MIVFFKMPKTASSSMTQSLNEIKTSKIILNITHGFGIEHAQKYLVTANRFKRFSQIDIFTFVRNPFNRLVSAYNYHIYYIKPHSSIKQRWGNIMRLKMKEELSKYDSFEHFCHNLEETCKNKLAFHFLPQTCWIYKKDKYLVDFIGKYENLQTDFKKLCIKLDISYHFTKKKRKSGTWSSPDYSSYYNKETKELVKEFYQKDFELLNYNMDFPII